MSMLAIATLSILGVVAILLLVVGWLIGGHMRAEDEIHRGFDQ